MTSLRLLGAVIFAVAALYTWVGSGYSVSFGDVLGPSAFPVIVGIPAMILSASLVVVPGGRVEWADRAHLLRQGAALAVLVAYAWLLVPLGFPLATFGLIFGLAMILGGPPGASVLLGAAMSLGLWALFDRVLGLPLAVLGPVLTPG